MAEIHSSFLSLFLLTCLFNLSLGDVGTATHYSPPYIPTACYRSDVSQFPTSNLFAAAGEGIWDNEAACGREYLVSCISAIAPSICVPGQTIQVRIVDRAANILSRSSREDATLVLSTTAFGAIANQSASFINVAYHLV